MQRSTAVLRSLSLGLVPRIQVLPRPADNRSVRKLFGSRPGWLGLPAIVLLVTLTSAIGRAQSVLSFSGSTVVGQQTAPLSVTLTARDSGASVDPIAVTQGIPNVDFRIASSGTCASGQSFTSGQQCTATVVFAPQRPGRRSGAVVLKSNDGRLLASALLTGVATGSLPMLMPGRIDTVAGDSAWTYQRDGVLATQASIFLPMGLAVDAAGNFFLADSSNNRIRRVDAQSGLISTVAGNGTPSYAGDGGLATAAMVNAPAGLLLDGAGNLFVADTNNHVIRRIDAVSGIITTVAGTPATQGYSGDGGAATAAHLSAPDGLAFDAAGDLLIADTGNHVLRRVDASTGIITTIAGTGSAGFSGDGGPATAAKLKAPWGLVVAADGSLVVADSGNNRIRSISPVGIITTIAGNGTAGFSGDGEAAATAELNAPVAVAMDPAGDLYIADSGNNRVREVSPATGAMATIAGVDSEQFSGDGGPSTVASLYGPYALAFDGDANLFIADMFHNRVRRISSSTLSIEYPTMRVGKLSAPQSEGFVNAGNATLNFSPAVLNNAALASDNTITTCAATLAAAGSCTFGIEFAPATVGNNVQGSVTFTSDAASPAPLVSLSGQVLSVEPTSVALGSSANPSVVGASVTFTATVTSADALRTGTVVFKDGGTQICSVILSVAGMATCSTAALTLGSHTFTASYSGDDNNAASTSPAFTQIVKQSPTLTLSTSPNPALVTTSVTLWLGATAPTGTPSGSVTFYDGSTSLGTVALSASGTASMTTLALVPGMHHLLAQYAGDASNASGSSNTVSEEIDQASTNVTLSTTNASPIVGNTITLTAGVTSPNGPAPTGSVNFTDNGSSLGTVTLDGNGSATLTVASLPPGNQSILAHYLGDTDDAGSTSAPLLVAVAQIQTTTTMASDANPLSAGATLHLAASVAIAAGATGDGALTGQVTFTDGGASLGTASLDATGHATIAVSSLSVATHSLVATYGGATNYATSSSFALNQQVQKTPTTTAVTVSATTVLTGKPVSFAVSVTSTTRVPTGTVTLHEGAGTLAQATLNQQGSASFTISSLSTGTHTLTVSYEGDANYLASTSSSWTETVNLAQPALTLSGPANPVDVGTNLTVTGTLTSPGVTPTGTFSLRDGGTVILTQSVAVSAAFSFTTSSLALGTHALSVVYSGDADNASATSAVITVTVQQAPTATALGVGANPATFGNPVTFTASVVSDSPGITGTVTFLDGSTALGTGTLGNGAASFTTSSLSFGLHSISAVYSGDADHATSTSTAVGERIVEPSAATLTSSADPAITGLDVVLTATIVASGGQTPTGSVIFHDGSGTLGTVTLDASGTAVLHTSTLAVGSHTITVSYAGDTNVAAASTSLTETIQSATTQVTLAASANPATFASPVALAATVMSNGGAATGTVTFTEDGSSIGSATLNGQGIAILAVSTLAPGTHILVANYAGDGRANASVSTPLAVVVKQNTSLSLASSADPTLTLSPVTLTATLMNSGAAAATGLITFSDGSTQLGTASLDGSGHASLTLPSLSSGTHTLLASYAGDGDDFGSVSAPVVQQIHLRATSIGLSGSQTDASNPQQVTLIAAVHSDGSAPPSGTVTFTSGALQIGAAPVNPNGVATLTMLIEANSGTENIIATYSGDGVFAGSSSSSTVIQAGPATQFTLAIDPSTLSIATRQHTTVHLLLSSIKGFSDTIQLGCLGLPFAATCTFTMPQSKLAADGTTTVDLTLDTAGPLGAGAQASARVNRPGLPILLCLFPGATLLVFGFAGRGRSLSRLMVVFCAAALALGAAGCSGLRGNSTPPGSYTFKITASGLGSGATQSQIVSLTVTQ